MTSAQEKAVAKIKRLLDKELDDKQEVKMWELDESYVDDCGLVFLAVEWGYKDDEGTLASVLLRERVHFMIGKRGGIKYFGTKVNGGQRLFHFDSSRISPMWRASYTTRQSSEKFCNRREKLKLTGA